MSEPSPSGVATTLPLPLSLSTRHLRRELGLQPGDELVLVLEEDGLRILTRDQAVRTARDLVRRYVSRDRSLVDELVEERRTEAADE